MGHDTNVVISVRFKNGVYTPLVSEFSADAPINDAVESFTRKIMRHVEEDVRNLEDSDLTKLVVEVGFHSGRQTSIPNFTKFVDTVLETPFPEAERACIIALEVEGDVDEHWMGKNDRAALYFQVGRLLRHIAGKHITKQEREDYMFEYNASVDENETYEAGFRFDMAGDDAMMAMNEVGVMLD
jgi:hypothetical protein